VCWVFQLLVRDHACSGGIEKKWAMNTEREKGGGREGEENKGIKKKEQKSCSYWMQGQMRTKIIFIK